MTSGQTTVAPRPARPPAPRPARRPALRAGERQRAKQDKIVAIAMEHFASARLRGREGRCDRGGGWGLQGRRVRLFRQQGRPVPGRLPERDPDLQPVSRGAGRGPRPGLLRDHQLLARAHAAHDPRGLDSLPGRADRELLLGPGAEARDHEVHAERGSVRDQGVRPVRRRPRRGQERHRDRADHLAGGLADRPLPGRDRDRGARPRAVRLLHPVGSAARAPDGAVRRVAAQRYLRARSRRKEPRRDRDPRGTDPDARRGQARGHALPAAGRRRDAGSCGARVPAVPQGRLRRAEPGAELLPDQAGHRGRSGRHQGHRQQRGRASGGRVHRAGTASTPRP